MFTLRSLIFVSLILSLKAYATSELTSEEVKRYLGGHDTVVCDVENRNQSLQIQFYGAPEEWVVWYLGDERGFHKIVKATATPLEGMTFRTDFGLSLDSGNKISLNLNTRAQGTGKLESKGRPYNLIACRPLAN